MERNDKHTDNRSVSCLISDTYAAVGVAFQVSAGGFINNLHEKSKKEIVSNRNHVLE
ncbi:hypothetical protein [Enterovibrio norvegicus]|uniref:hypothetical protein n=1 Tax=Enterovibrio norvegicus TaxID=188144 RepID=UPI00130463A8|nr:hypothetical protein [Enterovibrio norvegicus]